MAALDKHIDLSSLAQCQGRVFVGFSGGLDSHVLLHFLNSEILNQQTHLKICALHINHGLNEQADAWQSHCAKVCNDMGVEYFSERVKISKDGNLEAQARKARYKVFKQYLEKDDILLLAHHLDDQVETIFLKMLRGDAPLGLQGMPKQRRVGSSRLYRPFLNVARQQLESYARENNLKWVEDDSNQDTSFDRNYLRQALLPLINKRWPQFANNLLNEEARTSEAKQALTSLAKVDLAEVLISSSRMDLQKLKEKTSFRQVNLLRLWVIKGANYPSQAMLKEVLNNFHKAGREANPSFQWQGWIIERWHDVLYLYKALEAQKEESLANQIEALSLSNGQLLFNKSTSGTITLPSCVGLTVKFRQGGEKIKYKGQNKTLKNIFQENNMPPFLRDHWPLLFKGDDLVVIPGIPAWGVSSIYSENLLDQNQNSEDPSKCVDIEWQLAEDLASQS